MSDKEVEEARQHLYKKHKGYLYLTDEYIRLFMSSDVPYMAKYIQDQIDKGAIPLNPAP